MNGRQPRLIVTFHTTAEAMATERLCRENDLAGRLISVPRQLTSDCGIAWACAVELRQELQCLLEKERVDYEGIHCLA